MKALLSATLALVTLSSAVSAQDSTYATPDTSYVEYHDPPVTLPGVFGLRVPSYERVNGLTLPWGPHLELGYERVQIDALVTYRSNLGAWDPSLEGIFHPGEDNEIKAFAGRSTYTNDSWIRPDLVNSAAAFFVGSDSRNYFRGDRAALRYTRAVAGSAVTLTPFIGASVENDWSTGSFDPQKSPWSFLGRKDNLKMRRPNPAIAKGRINSAELGSGAELVSGDLSAKLDVAVEHPFSISLTPECSVLAPDGSCPGAAESFTQSTIDAHVSFRTFGAQTFSFEGHAVITGSNIAPPQRFAYLGGSGTLATVNLLALGGDRLLFVEGDYTIPIERIQLKFLGSPYVTVRYAAGSAGVGELPALIQNIGVGAGISFLRVDYSIDPASNRSPLSRRSAFSIGLSLTP